MRLPPKVAWIPPRDLLMVFLDWLRPRICRHKKKAFLKSKNSVMAVSTSGYSRLIEQGTLMRCEGCGQISYQRFGRQVHIGNEHGLQYVTIVNPNVTAVERNGKVYLQWDGDLEPVLLP